MEINVPDWLDKKFLTNALKNDCKDTNVEVVRFSVEPAMAPGNNYLSYMYRVRVEYKSGLSASNKTVSLMVKIPFIEGFMQELADKFNFFDKEPKIYNELLPSMHKASFCEFGPKSLNCPIKNVLVMKDLKEDGYVLKDKTKQLDYFHCKLVIEKLAKFHATSVFCLNNNKELKSEVGVNTFFVDNTTVSKMMRQALKNTVKAVTTDGRFERLSDFILKRQDQIWPTCAKLTQPKPDGGFNVLNHGDLWTNNILFKYNSSGEVVDVMFIDFQLSRVASPVNDLFFFIWSSTTEDVHGKRLKELLNIYLTTLNKTLDALGCDERLSEQEFKDDITRFVDFAIFVVSFPISLQMASPEDVPDFANLTDEDFETEKLHKLFNGKNRNKLLPTYFQHMTEFFLDGKGMPGRSS